jgi:hypothetical protein
MKYWFDTEFIEDGKTIDLMSIGIVAEDGRTIYLENNECDLSRGVEWVQHNVIVHLDWLTHGRSRDVIRQAVIKFVGDDKTPEFWAYYGAYDWVSLCQLFGPMVDLPKGWPMYCRDIKQWCDDLGNPKLPEQQTAKHHALNDAVWTMHAWDFLRKHIGAPRIRSAPDNSWRRYNDVPAAITPAGSNEPVVSQTSTG